MILYHCDNQPACDATTTGLRPTRVRTSVPYAKGWRSRMVMATVAAPGAEGKQLVEYHACSEECAKAIDDMVAEQELDGLRSSWEEPADA